MLIIYVTHLVLYLPPERSHILHVKLATCFPHAKQVLPNGLKVFLLEDPEVPLIRGALLMTGGQVDVTLYVKTGLGGTRSCDIRHLRGMHLFACT